MALFEDHLYNGSYPYLTPAEFLERCHIASGASETDFEVVDAIQDASLIMFYLTGRQFNGSTTSVVRPPCWCPTCSPYKLNIGLWPITDIIAVRERGVDLDPTDFHVDEYRYIVRNNGEQFDVCDNWTAAAGSPEDGLNDRWVYEVEVEHGLTAPPLLKRATAALACSLYADSTEGDCDLPERVTSVTRNGVSLEIADFTQLMSEGSTGIFAVDLAVKVLNPSRLQSPSFMWSPDLDRFNRRYT